MTNSKKKNIAILGSTGSIGTQTLEVVRNHSEKLNVEVLTAGSNVELLIEQAKEFNPKLVVIASEKKFGQLKDEIGSRCKVLFGEDGLKEAASFESTETVVTAMVGYAGLIPTIEAINAGKDIALANKETLVVAGELISKLAKEKNVKILPVDSEHSAIFQCLVGENVNDIERIILTASGGPFRGKTREDLAEVSREQALNHPNWSMGAKITIDSATLMNKGLEVIEAKWLFDIGPERISVVVHPQSIIHSMVEFKDQSIKAQLGVPDMRLPIQYALFYPERAEGNFPAMDISTAFSLDFEPPDLKTSQNLSLAFESLNKGGNLPCILNAANEVAVNHFLGGKIKFLEIAELNQACMQQVEFIQNPSLEDLIGTDRKTREQAFDIINTWKD